MNTSKFRMIDNYIYLYHLDKFFVIPTFPDSLQDQHTINYSSSVPMGRSAPVYSFAGSGPRALQINLDLHRDMMYEINYALSNAKIPIGSDYVDELVKGVQACAVPAYADSDKMVDPPMVAVRFGEDMYIKGVVTGSVGVQYMLPLLDNGKYAHVSLSFTVEEVDPYSATDILTQGSFRGQDHVLEGRLIKTS